MITPTPTTERQRAGSALQTFITVHPLLFAVLLTLFLALPLRALVLGLLQGSPHADDWAQLVRFGLSAIVLAWLLSATGWWRESGFTPLRAWRNVRVLWLPALLAALLIAAALGSGLDDDTLRVALAVPINLSTGFAEEAAFRGLILYVLLRAWGDRSVLRAVGMSSLLFGLMHLSNLTLHGTGEVLNQVLYTTLFGVAFAAFRLRTNTIWPVILIHTLINLVGGITEPSGTQAFTLGSALSLTLPTVVLAVYGLFLLRKYPAHNHA